MATLLLGMGGLTGRISGSASIGLLLGAPLLVRVLPTEAVELADQVPALGDPVVELSVRACRSCSPARSCRTSSTCWANPRAFSTCRRP
jgi:hypothetical protein